MSLNLELTLLKLMLLTFLYDLGQVTKLISTSVFSSVQWGQ